MPSDSPRRLPQVNSPSAAPAEGGGEAAPKQPLSSAGEAFRASLASALEEARSGLARLQASGNGRPARVAEELGAMALGPLDAERFAALLDPADTVDPRHLRRYQEAVNVLQSAVAGASRLEEVEAPPRESLRDVVDQALERRGRAFGAVRTLALLRSGGFREDEHSHLLEGLPFRQWRSLERDLSPPLIVHVDGSALETVAGLAEFLDGSQKIVLFVREPSPPAPLVRLLASGAMVLQTNQEEELAALEGFEGPAIAARMPDTAARFEYRPDSPGEGGDNLTVHHLPDTSPRAWIGGMSPRQQQSDLHLLQAWERRLQAPSRPPASGASDAGTDPGEVPTPNAESDPAERLAAWLLSQAELDDGGG
jgi:hypothetical protein